MKLSNEFTITNIAGDTVAFPVGQSVVDLNTAIRLQGAAAYICECLKEDLTMDELKTALYIKYDAADNEKAIIDKDLKDFLETALNKKLITV